MMTVRLFVAAALVGGVAARAAFAGDLIAIASFEEPPVFKGVQYTDTGDASQEHQLFNNPEEPWVEHTDPINELGFLAFYENTRDGVGLTDGDFVGVTDFVGAVGQYTDGFQGYQMGDPDGLMRVELDEVDLSGVGSAMLSVDYFLQETGWEEDDRIRIWVVLDDGTEIDVFNTEGMDIDDLESEGFWITGMANLSGAASAQLKAELDSNSGSETVYLDNIRFTGIAGNEIVVCPEAFERVRGLPVSGDLGSLCDSDDDRLATRPDVFAPAPLDDPAVQVELTATVAQTSPSQISFTVESSATVDRTSCSSTSPPESTTWSISA